MTPLTNESIKICNHCFRSSEETPFQKARKTMCSACRQGNVPTEEVRLSSIYYVYEHWDMILMMIIYVGSGTDQRAWWNWGSGARDNPAHSRFMFEQQNAGHNPNDIIRIVQFGMTKKESLNQEEILKQKRIEEGHSLKFCKDVDKYRKDKQSETML